MAKVISMVVLETSRDCYGLEDVGSTLTIGELIDKLSEFDSDMKVAFSNDNGYTYGSISRSDIRIKKEVVDEEDY